MVQVLNTRFDVLFAAKESEVEKIDERNVRVKEILNELNSDEDYYQPEWTIHERPDSVLEVSRAEMSCVPYESAKAREEDHKGPRVVTRRRNRGCGSRGRVERP